MMEWLWRISAKFAWRAFWAFVASAGGLAVIVASSWQDFVVSPPWIQGGFLAAMLVLLLAASGAALLYLNGPQEPGTCGPKYLLWYAHPARRISWRFANYLAMGGGTGQRVIIHGFQVSMRVNRGVGIVPKAAWVECTRTGTKHPVRFDVNHSGNRTTYKTASEIALIPAGVWLNGIDWLERAGEGGHSEGMPQEEFFQLFHDLTFNFEYEGGRFRKRFSRNGMRLLIQRFDDLSNPPASPRVRVREG